MIDKKDIIADLHTHTIFSKHAYSTIKENIDIARERNMKYIAVTDHFYQSDDFMERTNEIVRMSYVSKIAGCYPDISIVNGSEFNLDQHFNADVRTESLYKNVLWRPVGLHSWFLSIPDTSLKDLPGYFEATVNGKNGDIVKAVAFNHIEREIQNCKDAAELGFDGMKRCLAEIVDIAKAYDIILEVNESSLVDDRADNTERLKFWLHLAHEKNIMLYMGTDAHYCLQVGDFTNALEIINNEGISKEKILNHRCNEDLIRTFIS